jgi:cytochrome c556
MPNLKAAKARASFAVVARRGLLLAGCLLAPCAALSLDQSAQSVELSQSAQPAPSVQGPPAKDTIFARKILMGAIDTNMDEIETMLLPEGHLDLAEGTEHADTISIMLMSFPHLFPLATNQFKPGADRDPALDTYASPDLWANFADFYQRAQAASKVALEAARAKRPDDFRARILELRGACNGCHAAYQKVD